MSYFKYGFKSEINREQSDDDLHMIEREAIRSHVHVHPRRTDRQNFGDCKHIIIEFERSQRKLFDWVIRQRGCKSS